MRPDDFEEGKIKYSVKSGVTPADLAAELSVAKWADGFIAFANNEKRLGEVQQELSEKLLSDRINGWIEGAEGYVTEVNVWRSNGSIHEEVAAEREENTFYVQRWKLETDPANGSGDICWYREANTQAGSHHKDDKRLFSDALKTIEVVWPEKRLNFFITCSHGK